MAIGKRSVSVPGEGNIAVPNFPPPTNPPPPPPPPPTLRGNGKVRRNNTFSYILLSHVYTKRALFPDKKQNNVFKNRDISVLDGDLFQEALAANHFFRRIPSIH